MEYAVAATLFVLGACVGSFLNVIVLRFGYRETRAPRSHCAQCNVQLHWYDLVPIISYVSLSGRCRRCGSALTWMYPVVELTVGALFVASYVWDGASVLHLVAFAGFWTVLVGLVAYDIRHTLVPLPFIYALFGFALIRVGADALTFGVYAVLSDALLGALVCGGFFALITALTRGRGMGIGDAYIAAAIGAMLGLEAGVVSGVFAVWIGALVGIALLGAQVVFKQFGRSLGFGRVTLRTEIPFAPFLAIGAFLTYVTGYASILLGMIGLTL